MKMYRFFGTGSERDLRPVMTVAQVIAYYGLTTEQWDRLLARRPWIPLPVEGDPYDPDSLYEIVDVEAIGDVIRMDAAKMVKAQQLRLQLTVKA